MATRKIYERAIYGRNSQMQRKVYQRNNNVLPVDAGDYKLKTITLVEGGQDFSASDIVSVVFANQTTTAGTLSIDSVDANGSATAVSIATNGEYKRNLGGNVTINKGINGILAVTSMESYEIDTLTLQTAGSGYAVDDEIELVVGEGQQLSSTKLKVATIDADGGILTTTTEQSGIYLADVSGTLEVTGGTGTGAEFTIAVDATGTHVLTGASVNAAGTGYEADAIFDINPDSITTTAGKVKIESVDSNGAIEAVSVNSVGEYSDDASGNYPITTGSGLIVKVEMELIA